MNWETISQKNFTMLKAYVPYSFIFRQEKALKDTHREKAP